MKEKSNLYENLACDIAHLIDAGTLLPASVYRRCASWPGAKRSARLDRLASLSASREPGPHRSTPPVRLLRSSQSAAASAPTESRDALPHATTVNISELVMRRSARGARSGDRQSRDRFPKPDLMPNAKFHSHPGRRLERDAGPKRTPMNFRLRNPPASPGDLASRFAPWLPDRSRSEIVTTVGGMEALHICLGAVTSPGDAVAVETPGYYGALQLMEWLGLTAVEIPRARWRGNGSRLPGARAQSPSHQGLRCRLPTPTIPWAASCLPTRRSAWWRFWRKKRSR